MCPAVQFPPLKHRQITEGGTSLPNAVKIAAHVAICHAIDGFQRTVSSGFCLCQNACQMGRAECQREKPASPPALLAQRYLIHGALAPLHGPEAQALFAAPARSKHLDLIAPGPSRCRDLYGPGVIAVGFSERLYDMADLAASSFEKEFGLRPHGGPRAIFEHPRVRRVTSHGLSPVHILSSPRFAG